MATIRDVAREAGVAVSTVSKYLNGGNVLEENRISIEKAVAKFKYKVNFHAHAMRSGDSGLVLVMVPQFDDEYCVEIMSTARRVLVEHGYIAILAETRGDQKKENDIIRRAIEHQVEGVISLHTDLSLPIYDELYRRKIPLVVIGKAYKRKLSGCVYFDDSEKFTRMFRMLKQHGHSRIGVVGGGIDKARLHSREFAYYLSLFDKAGLQIDENYIFTDSGKSVETGVEAVRYFNRMDEPPSAVVCMNSGLLYGVYVALREFGYRIPEDVSLCVLARRSEIESKLISRFAAVYQPVEEATERAVGLLMDSIHAMAEGKAMPHTVVQLETELREGITIAKAKDYTGLKPKPEPETIGAEDPDNSTKNSQF